MNDKNEDDLVKSQNNASIDVQSEAVKIVSKAESKAEERQKLLRILYGQQLITSFGNGMVSPFLSVYLIKIGGSASDLGWFQAITNFFTNTAQIFWGRLSDVTGKRIMFIVIGSILSSILWAFIIGVRSPELFILIIALQSFLASMSAPALSALIAELSPTMQRGVVIGIINTMGAVSSLTATLISGFIMQISLTSDVFVIPFIMASVAGIAGSLLMLKMRSVDRTSKSIKTKDLFRYNLFSPLRNETFKVFIGASFLSNFMMAISWPLFNITTIELLNATMLEIAILSVISGFSTFAFQRYVGKLTDKVGRRPIILINRFGLVSVPLFYAFAPDMSILYVSGLSTGILIAMGNVAFIAYVIDISDPMERASYIALYNAANGTGAFFGSLLGGYIGNVMIEKFGLRNGLMYTYLISAIGRAGTALMFLKIKDVMKFPETIFSEFTKITNKMHYKSR
ncbi:MAG: MFS transporter [Thermoprotei archaeon]